MGAGRACPSAGCQHIAVEQAAGQGDAVGEPRREQDVAVDAPALQADAGHAGRPAGVGRHLPSADQAAVDDAVAKPRAGAHADTGRIDGPVIDDAPEIGSAPIE